MSPQARRSTPQETDAEKIAQWEEMLLDPEQKIARPRQVYLGYGTRDYIPIGKRV